MILKQENIRKIATSQGDDNITRNDSNRFQ